MTTSRLFPSTNGPSSPTPYAGPFIAGIGFKCLGPAVQWLQGYYAWVPAGGDLIPNKCALWQSLTSTTGSLIPGTVVTSGALTAGQWNFIPLASPVPLSLGTPYIAGRGWTSVNGFPDVQNQFGAAQPFSAGFTSGNLFAYSDNTGTAFAPSGGVQGPFSSVSADPSAQMPDQGSNSANFWTDILVSDTAPAGYAGPFQLFPANVNGNLSVALDLGVNYNVGTEFALSAPATVQAIRYLSPSGAVSLATRASIWSVTGGGLTRTEIPSAVIASPSWSGAAGSGWVQVNYSAAPLLPAGRYTVAVYNANGTSGGWNAKDSITGAWATGDYSAGVSNGILSAPGVSGASTCYDYNGANSGATPPYSAGTTEAGQNVFGQLPSGLPGAPYLYAAPSQNYFVDVIVNAAPAAGGGPLLPDYEPSLLRKRWLW